MAFEPPNGEVGICLAVKADSKIDSLTLVTNRLTTANYEPLLWYSALSYLYYENHTGKLKLENTGSSIGIFHNTLYLAEL